MKKIFNYILLFTALLMSTVSCESDIEKIHVDDPTLATPPVLTSDGETNIVPNTDNINQFATVFNWTRALMGEPVIPVTYTLMVDTTDVFSTPTKLTIGTNQLSQTLTYKVLNDWGLAYTKDIKNPEPLNLFVRVAGSVLTQNSELIVSTDSVYSNYLALNVTPFLSEPAVIYLPGDYLSNGWTPEKSPLLYSESRNGIYTGYINLNTKFKIILEPNWDGVNYGSGGSGKLDASGGDIDATPGFYWMEVDMNKLSYTLTPVTFSVIGSIKGDWNEDFVMTYDVNNNVLSVTNDFSTGKFKFRKDKNWDFAYGIDDGGNLTLQDGKDIPLELVGKVTISLNLWDYMKPTYSIKATN